MPILSSLAAKGRRGAPSVGQPLKAGSTRLALATLERPPQGLGKQWKVAQINCDVDDAKSMNDLLPLFQQAGPLLLYLHGYNSTPADCFERCDRLQSLYGLEILRFSWSSRQHLLDDGFCPGFDAGMDDGLQRELARLFGSRSDWRFTKYPAWLCPAAGDLENLTCSWWLLMALPGVRH